MSELVGHRLAARYAVESLIGRGGMADVYAGTDTTLERPVAIKILTDRSDAVLRRFLREAQSMAKLNHHNIVAVYDAGQAQGVSYIVMELVAGRTLAQIAAADVSMHTAIRYFIDLLEALAYAHEQNVIHRDIKPANVMVADDGTIKVMDFGLSRRTSDASSVTNAGEIVGTVAYLAPERFLGQVADARSDLYSVGVVMYEFFTAALPFKTVDDDLVAVIFAHVNEQPASLRTLNRSVPQQIDALVLKLLEKQADQRFQTARELIAELQALIGGPATAPAPSAANKTGAASLHNDKTAAASEALRNALDRTFGGKSPTSSVGSSNTLAGMLAARKRDYPEAIRSFTIALQAFEQGGNQIEHAKTALKFAAVIQQKNSEIERPVRREVEEAAQLLSAALPSIRGQRLAKEVAEGERVLYALQRMRMRLH